MRIAIAGLGAAAHTIHIPACRTVGLEIVGGCDPNARASDFSFPLFATVGEMLDKTRPDILTVATPPHSHASLIREGVQAGCHVFCEKPMVETAADADEVIALSARTGRHVVVNNQYRFMRIHRAAQACIGTAGFGKLRFAFLEQTFFMTRVTEAGWRGAHAQRTVKEFGTHAFDLCRFFFGEDPVAISARMPRGADPDSPDYLALMTLEFSGDRVAHVVLNRTTRGRHRYLDIRLDGTEGTVETSLGGRLELAAGINPRLRRPFLRWDMAPAGTARFYHGEHSRLLDREPASPFSAATAELMRAVITALKNENPPPSTAADNRPTLEALFGAYESAQLGRPVTLSGR